MQVHHILAISSIERVTTLLEAIPKSPKLTFLILSSEEMLAYQMATQLNSKMLLVLDLDLLF